MECYYHPNREGTDNCAICGKSICKECGLEIAGKTYCKECLEKIIGLELDSKAKHPEQTVIREEPVKTEPARLNKQPVNENIYQPQDTYDEFQNIPQPEEQPVREIKQIGDDSPYNIKDSINYSGGLESSYLHETEPQVVQTPERIEQQSISQKPPVAEKEITQQPTNNEPEYIYPDHSYEPQPTSARMELEDKYEKYLDDLYFDENEIPLDEQLAKDEKEYGSLTRKPYRPKKQKPVAQKNSREKETPEEMEARIRAEILQEKEGRGRIRGSDNKSIHNINYKDEKEPMSVVDIILTIILVIVILIVIYYLIYIFLLNSYYPTFMDAVYGLTNPQNVINNILSNN